MVGLTSSLELTIFNVGEELLVVDSIYSNLPEFIPSSSEMNIEVGESYICEITFTPQNIQGYSGQLTINSNDPDNSTLSVSLSGSGIEPDADIYVEQDTLDFGDAYEGVTSTLPLVITNIGSEDLEIEEVEFGMVNESPFSTDFENATLEAGDSVIVEISFYYSPDRTVFEDVLSIYSNDPEDSELNVFLIANIPPQDIDVTPAEFSVQLWQGESSTQTLTISNTGGEPLEVELSTGVIVTDIDGNVYQTVQIGEQVWMAENLKVTHYNDGSDIPTGYSNSEWADLDETETGAYAIYPADNDAASQATCGGDCSEVYGNLYNLYAVETGNLAPEGWHVPTDEEWMELEMALGMSESEAQDWGWRGTNQGSQLAGRADLWFDSNLENNEAFGTSGFDGLPGGYRNHDGNYHNMGYFAYFWSSTENGNSSAWGRWLECGNSGVGRYGNDKKGGLSVRCVRDVDNLTIRDNNFRDEWLTLSADSLTISPDSSYNIDVTFDAANLEIGEYLADIIISSNDPDEPMVYVPVTLEVISLAVDDALLIPKQFTLHPNHPNPFNPITSLRYDLPEQAQVTLTIYNMLGREVTQLVNTTQDAGYRSVQWNATDMHGKSVSAGVYLYQIQAGEFVQTKKMVLLK